MNRLLNEIARRLPTWAGRAVWLMLAISGGWVAYRFGHAYSHCRSNDTEKAICIVSATWNTFFDVWLLIIGTLFKIATVLLP